MLLSCARALAWPWNPRPLRNSHLCSSHHIKFSALSTAIPTPGKEEGDGQGGYIWLPTAPLVPQPRALYNAASLAYLGDCIYEDVFLKLLLKDGFLTEEERNIVRWGKNVQTSHKRATKRAGAAVYSRASSLETLIGYLYLSNPGRLQELMNKLGLTWSSATNVKKVEPKN